MEVTEKSQSSYYSFGHVVAMEKVAELEIGRPVDSSCDIWIETG